MLRNGISLVGSGAGMTTISGTATYNHSTLGGALNSASLQATIVVGDATRTATISNLSVVANQSAQPSQYSVFGVFCDTGSAVAPFTNPPVSPYPAPTLVVDSVTIGPGFGTGLVATNTAAVNNACNLLLTRSTLTGNGFGAWVVGGGFGTGSTAPIAAQIGDLSGGGNRFVKNMVSGSGYGLVVWDTSSPVRVYGNTFDQDDYGMALGQHPLFDTTIKVVDYINVQQNVFQNLNIMGISLGASAIIDQLIGNTFSNISGANFGSAAAAYAIQLTGPGNGSSGINPYRTEILHARGNQFIGNDIAIGILGNPPIDVANPLLTDFGTAADPGKNVFRCNSMPSPAANPGGDLFITSGARGAGTLSFAGNAWDHATLTQSTTLTPNGIDLVVPSPGPAVTLTGATVSTVACPAGRTP